MPAKSKGESSKVQTLLEEGTLNPTPAKVRDPKFRDNEFFDPRDVVQVKYEMLRRVSIENASVADAIEEYGVSRPTYYETKAHFDKAGVAGLVPQKRGPHGPHKLQGEVLAFVEQQLVAGEPVRAREISRLIREKFDLNVHPRTIERAVAGKKLRDDECKEQFARAIQRHDAIRNSAQCRPRRRTAARSSCRAYALSPSRLVGMGAGDGHNECVAAAKRVSAIQLEGARGIQNRDSHLCSNGDQNQPPGSNTMNESLKVQPHHLERGAYLYIRQSSMRQVIENVESTKRQYALRSRAIALGWRDDQIIVIDNDQGESGASAAWREGFQRLVTDVGMGHAGIVMGLEVSRLARNNADWHRLLEICALADTLILDEDGVYDPTSFNDRLLLGLKGAMSEAELHVLKARLRGGILNKARRGEYHCPLPTGFIYDETGNVVLDPDTQIREAIAYFFETFSRVGSASQTVKMFRNEGLVFPSRLRIGDRTVFRPLTASTAMRMLNNPRYAGVYVYGRRQYRRAIDGKKKIQRKREHGDWLACIPNAHPGYISWEQFQENLKILQTNGRGYEAARSSPPREGAALLQGRAVCGRCGRHFRIRYATRRGRQEAWYVCDRGHTTRGEPNCQSIAGPPIDQAIGLLVTESMTPAAIELALEIRREIEARHEEADQMRCRVIERAQIEADLAQRRFMLVDPNNRLVADTLEREWNDKLRTLTEAHKERERARQRDHVVLDDAIRQRLAAMTTDFRKLWDDPSTPNRERKRLLSYVIEDATLIKIPAEGTTKIHVRFKGGKTEALMARNPKSSAQQIQTQPEIVELIDQLLDHHVYSQIADILNERGFRPGGSARPGKGADRFTAKRVAYLIHTYGLCSRYDRLRERGMLTNKEMADRLGIHQQTVDRWAECGIIKAHFYNDHGWQLYEPPGPNMPAKHCSRWDRLVDRAATVQAGSQRAGLELKEV